MGEVIEMFEKCPRCIDERMLRVMGRLLVCPNCDLQMITKITDKLEVDVTLPPTPPGVA